MGKGKHEEWILDLLDFQLDAILEIKRHAHVQSRTAQFLLTANRVLDEYRDTKVAVRQLYYQFVARGMIVNNRRSYMNFDKSLTKARKGEVIAWDRLIDTARAVLAGEDRPICDLADRFDPAKSARSQLEDALEDQAGYYDLRKWHGQPNYVEVWTEKDALARILEPICEKLSVKLVVARGYCSHTFKKEGENRLAENGKQGIILYFGDLDPSGWDMCEGLGKFLPEVEIQKVALVPDQIAGLPSNPVKEKDPRTPAFQKAFPQFKGQCWELDALAPNELQNLVRNSIAACFDSAIKDKNKETVRKWREDYGVEWQRLVDKLDLSVLDD